ncbi:MAG: hypothetical protein FJ319_07350 [SAR202 cluster bacterium]|nr:hypothetical protein [SAR202 cluster bacterium]
MVIADSTVLISLAKVGCLRLLKERFSYVVIAPTVLEEVVTGGIRKGATEVARVQLAIREGWISIAEMSDREAEIASTLVDVSGLDRGEAESISIVQARRFKLIVDDREARSIAASMQLEHAGTIGVLLEMHLGGHISDEEFEKYVVEVAKVLWVSPEVIAEVLRRAKRKNR